MIVIPTDPLYGLCQQGKLIFFQRALQATHHRDFVFQATLQIYGAPLLQVFGVIGCQGEICNGAQLTQQKIKVHHRGTHVAIADSHLRLERHPVPEKAETLDMQIQLVNTGLIRLGIQP